MAKDKEYDIYKGHGVLPGTEDYPWGKNKPSKQRYNLRRKLAANEAGKARLLAWYKKTLREYEDADRIIQHEFDEIDYYIRNVYTIRLLECIKVCLDEGRNTREKLLNPDGSPTELAKEAMPMAFPKVFKGLSPGVINPEDVAEYNGEDEEDEGNGEKDAPSLGNVGHSEYPRNNIRGDQIDGFGTSRNGPGDESSQGHGDNTDQFHKQPNDPQGRGPGGDMNGTVSDNVPKSNGNAGGSDRPRSSEFSFVPNL